MEFSVVPEKLTGWEGPECGWWVWGNGGLWAELGEPGVCVPPMLSAFPSISALAPIWHWGRVLSLPHLWAFQKDPSGCYPQSPLPGNDRICLFPSLLGSGTSIFCSLKMTCSPWKTGCSTQRPTRSRWATWTAPADQGPCSDSSCYFRTPQAWSFQDSGLFSKGLGMLPHSRLTLGRCVGQATSFPLWGDRTWRRSDVTPGPDLPFYGKFLWNSFNCHSRAKGLHMTPSIWFASFIFFLFGWGFSWFVFSCLILPFLCSCGLLRIINIVFNIMCFQNGVIMRN